MNLINKYKYLNIILILYKIMKSTYFLLTLFIILTSYGIQAGVQYQYPFCILKYCRTVISTTYLGTTPSTSKRTLKATYDNSKGKTDVENTYQFSETVSRSMSASASVGASILGAEVGATLGGSASYSRTQGFSYKVTIPAGKIGRVYASEKTETARFRHVIQPQEKGLDEPDSKYRNVPGMKQEFSTVTTKSPVFSFETS
jgi:hypothetical protein